MLKSWTVRPQSLNYTGQWEGFGKTEGPLAFSTSPLVETFLVSGFRCKNVIHYCLLLLSYCFCCLVGSICHTNPPYLALMCQSGFAAMVVVIWNEGTLTSAAPLGVRATVLYFIFIFCVAPKGRYVNSVLCNFYLLGRGFGSCWVNFLTNIK